MGKSSTIIQHLNDVILQQQKEIHRLELELVRRVTPPPSPPPSEKQESIINHDVLDYMRAFRPTYEIDEFIELFNRYDYDEQTGDGFSAFSPSDCLSATERGTWDCDRHNYWVLDRIQSVVNRISNPLSNRTFHSTLCSNGSYTVYFYEDGEWINDAAEFEKKVLRLLRNMLRQIMTWIRDIELPLLAYRNAENVLYNICDRDGNPKIEKMIDGCSKTATMRAITEHLIDNIANPFTFMTQIRKKIILTSAAVASDKLDKTIPIYTELEPKNKKQNKLS